MSTELNTGAIGANIASALPRTGRHLPLPTLGKLTSAAVGGLGLALIYLQAAIIGQVEPPLAIFAGLMLLVAGLIWGGWRWLPLAGALLSALSVAGNIDHIVYDFAHPESFHTFAFVVVSVGLALVGMLAGIAATVQNYRSAKRQAPRGTTTSLVAFGVLCAMVILVATIPPGAGPGVSPEALAQLPAIGIPGMRFDQKKLMVKAGQTVALRLDNAHSAPHSFDIDALDVHVPVAAGAQSLILFTPTQPGAYIFYCALPGHREAGMQGTLVVAPLLGKQGR
jgi:heme/copper-type cytochrome/quinol oxidase subunit 2